MTNDLPRGYRWATADEAEAHSVVPNPGVVVVPRTVDASGVPYTEGEADLALPVRPVQMSVPLPRDEDGFVITSASYGELWAVEIIYNTDPEGNWVDDDDYSNRTLHGPLTRAEAEEWMDAYPDEDRDLKDMNIVVMNAVRPVV
jgi:hypothetical protein